MRPETPPQELALSATGVRKQFGGVHALTGAHIAVSRSEVHALLGENGAGKSTLVRVLAGVVRPDEGEVLIDGEALPFGSPQESRAAGIAVVYQELSLIPQLSVAHNLVLADLPGRGGWFSLRKAESVAEEALGRLGLQHIDPRAPVSSLPLDQRQMVEIAKGLRADSRILVLDEATSSLGNAEVEQLFELVRGLRASGTTVVVITHRMHEVWALADRLTIFRDGATVGQFGIEEIDQHEAVSLMAGRDIRAVFPPKAVAPTDTPLLELRDVRLRRDQTPWNLTLRAGEILGLGGLQGQGQRHFLQWLYGAQAGHGTVYRDGRRVKIRQPSDALKHGIALIPEDRGVEGLHPNLPVRWNLAMATLGGRSTLGVIHLGAEREMARSNIARMAIKVSSPFQSAATLSGGTQQKVVISKFMATEPRVLLFVDSTRGVDVQTKFEFYEMLRAFAESGAACVVYSSDTEELVGLCDRVAVFHDGVPAITLEGDEITQDAVVAASFAVVAETQP